MDRDLFIQPVTYLVSCSDWMKFYTMFHCCNDFLLSEQEVLSLDQQPVSLCHQQAQGTRNLSGRKKKEKTEKRRRRRRKKWFNYRKKNLPEICIFSRYDLVYEKGLVTPVDYFLGPSLLCLGKLNSKYHKRIYILCSVLLLVLLKWISKLDCSADKSLNNKCHNWFFCFWLRVIWFHC